MSAIERFNNDPTIAEYRKYQYSVGIRSIEFRFTNGYGASVINDVYGSMELAVLKRNGSAWDLNYDTPITYDVIPGLDVNEVLDLFEQIKNLPTHKE